MKSSLNFAKHDVQTVWGHGAHNGNHGGVVFARRAALVVAEGQVALE